MNICIHYEAKDSFVFFLYCTGAVDDFSVAIDMEPRIHDLYKRRSQALGALGDHAGAGWDLTRAVSLSPDNESKLDAYVDLARVSQKRQDHVNAEIAARVRSCFVYI